MKTTKIIPALISFIGVFSAFMIYYAESQEAKQASLGICIVSFASFFALVLAIDESESYEPSLDAESKQVDRLCYAFDLSLDEVERSILVIAEKERCRVVILMDQVYFNPIGSEDLEDVAIPPSVIECLCSSGFLHCIDHKVVEAEFDSVTYKCHRRTYCTTPKASYVVGLLGNWKHPDSILENSQNSKI